MKTCIFLIILLGFIEVVFCGNLTELIEDESYQECPISLFRRKRANLEYTRWRANVETTPEFIVKVLDEEVSTSNINQIVAVNILPVTKRGEKIIVGGAMVPPPTASVSSADLSKEYTRFVPPTTLSVTQIAEDVYLAPQPQPLTLKEEPPPIRPPAQSPPPFIRSMAPVQNVRRDESPPASPQFISRVMPKVLARQYAPIAPVAFTRRSTVTPLTPPTHDYNKEFVQPTRSTYPAIYHLPSRSSQEEHPTYPSVVYEDRFKMPQQSAIEEVPATFRTVQYDELRPEDVFVSRTTIKSGPDRTLDPPGKTTDINFVDDNFDLFPLKRPKTKYDDSILSDVEREPPGIEELQDKTGESSEKQLDVTEKQDERFLRRKFTTVTEKDADYNNFFYNDEYKDVTTRKPSESSIHFLADEYDDKSKDKEINAVSHDKFEGSDQNDDTKESITEKDVLYRQNQELDIVSTTLTTMKNITISIDVSTTKAVVVTPEMMISKPVKLVKAEKRTQICSMLKLRQLNFNSPRTLPEIVSQLKQWAEDSPVAKWVDITDGNLTTMENPIYMMIVDDPSSGQIISAKQTVMIVAGIQGRDHHAVAAAMYILYQLVERSESHTDLLTKYRFWIIPVFNPDGYDYSMTFPHRREWTKNLRQTWDNCKGRESCRACETFGLRCTIQPCYGVNLDRNFEYQWIPTEELKAEHPCGSLYAGERQLSEAETRSLTHFLHDQRTPLYTFIAFKEGDVLGVMYPYSHTRKKKAFDHVYRQRASRAAAAAYSISGRPYVAGQTSEFLPLYAGGIEDWVDSHVGIDNTYTIMMFRPSDSYNSKLITERVVHETYAATDTLLMQSSEVLSPPSLTLTRAKASRIHPLSLSFIFSVLQLMLT